MYMYIIQQVLYKYLIQSLWWSWLCVLLALSIDHGVLVLSAWGSAWCPTKLGSAYRESGGGGVFLNVQFKLSVKMINPIEKCNIFFIVSYDQKINTCSQKRISTCIQHKLYTYLYPCAFTKSHPDNNSDCEQTIS